MNRAFVLRSGGEHNFQAMIKISGDAVIGLTQGRKVFLLQSWLDFFSEKRSITVRTLICLLLDEENNSKVTKKSGEFCLKIIPGYSRTDISHYSVRLLNRKFLLCLMSKTFYNESNVEG